MKVKKIPMRTCIITKEKLPKQELIRIVKTNDGKIVIDETGKINGHGVYLKKDLTIFERAKKNKILNKLLEIEIKEEFFQELEKVVK